MTSNLLFDLLINLHEANYNVVAMVSDMGSTNIGLWRDLNISTDNVAFLHPISNSKVYVFADVPHLLKLARNHFIDQ